MKLDFAFFSDAATLDVQTGKLNVLGIFENIHAEQYPFTHRRMAFVCKITAHRSETGEHAFRINVVDEDGREVVPSLSGDLTIKSDQLSASLIMEMNETRIPKPGVYAVDILVDNHYLGSTAVHAVETK